MQRFLKVLLIEPPFYIFQGIQPCAASFGLAMLASAIQKDGHDVRVFSPDFEFRQSTRPEKVVTSFEAYEEKLSWVIARLDEIVDSFSPAIVGISLWTARSGSGIRLARHLKGCHQGIILVAGGIHASILPDEVLSSGVFDYLISGEGELAFSELVSAISGGGNPQEKDISGLAFIRNGKFFQNTKRYCENLDMLPYPAYETFINFENFDPNALGSLMMSRGCPFQCNYCASHMLWTRNIRYHSPGYIVGAMKHLYYRFGTKHFRFDDDTFTIRKDAVKEVCKLIKKMELNITWHCDTRVELVNKEMLFEMKDAGLVAVAMGVESANLEMRKAIRKTSSLEETKKAFKMAKEVGLNTVAYFMIGLPGETFAMANESLDFIEELNPTSSCISIFTPYPGTEAFSKADQLGVIRKDKEIDWTEFYHHSRRNFSGAMSDAEWDKLLDRVLKMQKNSWVSIFSSILRVNLGEVLSRYKTSPKRIFMDIKHLWQQ